MQWASMNGIVTLSIAKSITEPSILTLNRPESMNAFSLELVDQLENAIESYILSSSRALIITGTGKAFCAGADLKERKEMSEDQVHRFLDRLGLLFRKIEQLKSPVICAINGFAFGGGLELALCADFRFVASSARIGLTETSLGIIPGAGGTQRLPRLIGAQKARDLIFTARRLDANEACSIGLVDRITSDETLITESIGYAKEILSNAPLAVELAKNAISNGMEMKLHDALIYERELYNQTLQTEDRIEALKAFQEKRKPVFQGK